MKLLFTPLLVCTIAFTAVEAQKKDAPAGTPTTQAYGKVDMADMELKACDFEKDANAMVLFDKADSYFEDDYRITMARHKRIKIFNDNGKNEANIRIEYYSGSHYEYITGIDAETFNLVNGKIEVTKLDRKLLYSENIDKSRSAYVFSFPNVKPGSVIEYKYTFGTQDFANFPDWAFQAKIPVRYSELNTQIPDIFYFRVQSRVTDPLTVYKTSSDSRSTGSGANTATYNVDVVKRGIANIHSLPDEPYMSSVTDNLQAVIFQLTSIRPVGNLVQTYSDSWAKVGGILADHEDFGSQFKRKLTNEDAILAKAKAMHSDAEKMAYIFKEVQSAMKWDGQDRWYANDGTVKAWDKKTGNSAEINLILYHLLYRANLPVYPMVVSTRDHGKVNPSFTFLYQFNRAVVFVPQPDDKYFIMDATGKYNIYNETPDNLLNSTALYIDKDKKLFETIFLKKETPVLKSIFLQADIKADGKMAGTVQVSDYGYNRIASLKKYKTDGEQKYIDYLRNNDNNLKLSGLKFENMEVDSLPLTENMDFKMDLNGSDGNYIYVAPAFFSPVHTNPFLSANRTTDIDFGYRDNFVLNASYKIPEGFKTDVLPKNITMQMPDQGIVFKRVVAEQDGAVIVRYTLDHKKIIYFKETYPDLYDFYKKLQEMLNEQIVFKKG